jgi:hypothetical protein
MRAEWSGWWSGLKPEFTEVRDVRLGVAHGAWEPTSSEPVATLTRKGNGKQALGRKPIKIDASTARSENRGGTLAIAAAAKRPAATTCCRFDACHRPNARARLSGAERESR